jgi:hypothetical protein
MKKNSAFAEKNRVTLNILEILKKKNQIFIEPSVREGGLSASRRICKEENP